MSNFPAPRPARKFSIHAQNASEDFAESFQAYCDREKRRKWTSWKPKRMKLDASKAYTNMAIVGCFFLVLFAFILGIKFMYS